MSTYQSVQVGDALPALEIPITRTLILATAIASRDFFDGHHDPSAAQAKGSKDIFMNILTTNGLVGRFVTDWAGPEAFMKSVNIRLGVPNYPGDTMTLTGAVVAKNDDDASVQVDIVGANASGNHVTGSVSVRLPRGDGK